MTLATAMSALFLISCSDDDDDNNTVTLNDNGYEYVDLGLPSGTLWATKNIGATEVYDYGDYFAWGEITTKDNYDWDPYIYYDSSDSENSTITKYNTSDGKTSLDLDDDAARQNWGGDWRFPTIEELEELVNNCTWTWTSNYEESGVSGFEVSSDTGSIFLPAVGYFWKEGVTRANSIGYYWSSSLSSNDTKLAQRLYFTSGNQYLDDGSRYKGYAVRPVRSASTTD